MDNQEKVEQAESLDDMDSTFGTDVPEDEDEPTTDEFGDVPTILVADQQTLILHEACKGFADCFRSLNDEIETMRASVVNLKKQFKVRRGTAGIVIKFPDIGEVYWSQYCERVFGLTSHRVNQLLDAKDDKPANQIKVEVDPEMKFAKWIKLGYDRAVDQMAAKGVDTKQSAPMPDKQPASLTKADKDYLVEQPHYPAVIAKEIFSVLSEDRGMSSVEIKKVIEEMQKLNQPTVKAMKNRFDEQAATAAA